MQTSGPLVGLSPVLRGSCSFLRRDFRECGYLISMTSLCPPRFPHEKPTGLIPVSTKTSKPCPATEGIQGGNDYLVAVIGRAAGVQAGQKALRLLLNAGRGWQGQQQSGQLLSCVLVSLLMRKTAGLTLTPPNPCRTNCVHAALPPSFFLDHKG